MGLFSSIGKLLKPVASLAPAIGSFFGPVGTAIGTGVKFLGDKVLPAAREMIPSILEGAIGVGGDYLSDKLIGQPQAAEAYAQSKAGTAKAYERNVDFYSNRYQRMMADMKKAGLNPILAAASGMSTSMSPQASPAQGFQARAPYASFGSSAKSMADASLSRQKKAESVQQALKIRAEQGLVTKQEQLAHTTIHKINATLNKIRHEIVLLKRQKTLTEQQIRRESQLINLTKLQANRLVAELAKLRKIAKTYNVPYLGTGVAAIKEILGTLPVGILLGKGR